MPLPPKIDPRIAHSEMCAVLESLGYTIKERNVKFPPYDVFASHQANLPIIVNIFDLSIDVSSHWPCARDFATEGENKLLVTVNDMNALTRLITCLAEQDRMTLRACFPFPFDQDLFRTFMVIWMEDAEEVMKEVINGNLGFLIRDLAH